MNSKQLYIGEAAKMTWAPLGIFAVLALSLGLGLLGQKLCSVKLGESNGLSS